MQDCSLGDLLCEDLEDEDLGMGERGTGEWRMEYPGTRNPVQKRIAGSPITMETAKVSYEYHKSLIPLCIHVLCFSAM